MSKRLIEISLFDEHNLDTLKNDTVTVRILKKGGLPSAVYRLPEICLADVLKKEEIEEDIDCIFTEVNLYHDHKCVLRFYLDEDTYRKKKCGLLSFKEVFLDTCEHLQRERVVSLNLFSYEDKPQ